MKKRTLPLTSRPLSRQETEQLRESVDATPGTPITLFVCQEGWHDDPTERVLLVPVPAPDVWDHLALADIISRVLTAGHEHAEAHLDEAPADSTKWKPYCRLHFGRHIHRGNEHETHVDPRVPFLYFRSPDYWYTVALPVFPIQAVTTLLRDDTLTTEVQFNFNRFPAVIPGDFAVLGPRSQMTVTPRRPRRRSKQGGRR